MKPILIIQMQRMGDLILTFPLLLWLKRRYPGQPLLVLAEPHFASQLAPIGPDVEYVSFASHISLLQREYALVINLSHRREAAWLTGMARAEEKVGPFLDHDQNMYIRGKWQLYRAALVNNNRHNMFHWADLNALDVIGLADLKGTSWPLPRRMPPTNKKIGIFLGASQEEKRPPSAFWGDLARALVMQGLRPVLLGGPAEKRLARDVMSRINVSVLDLCGKMNLQQFARIGQTLHLMITPDTGPMHLAAWSGLRTLNLSMGPVNPWETGPYQPGHLVLRSTMSCSGCWSCRFGRPACIAVFDARKVARCAYEIVQGREKNLEKFVFPGLELMTTSRGNGLYALESLQHAVARDSCRYALDDLWHFFWGYHFGLWKSAAALASAQSLRILYPDLMHQLRIRALDLHHEVKTLCERQMSSSLLWAASPPYLRPLTGYIQLMLTNGNFSRRTMDQALALVGDFLSLLD